MPKILTIFFFAVFIIQLICLVFLLVVPQTSRAADVQFTPQVSGLNYTFDAKDASTGNIARYVRAIYKYAIGIVGILAAVVLMIGGVIWIMAGGNATMIGEAKSWIGASLTGLILALLSYLILATVNPALVNLRTTDITKVEKISTVSANDDAIRSLLQGKGIYINKSNCTIEGQTNCTSLAGLPQNAIDGVIKIKNDGGLTYIMITGGTEAGHKEHGSGLPVLDLRLVPAGGRNVDMDVTLLKYIHDKVGLGFLSEMEINQRYTATDGSFDVIREENADKSQHFHIRFK